MRTVGLTLIHAMEKQKCWTRKKLRNWSQPFKVDGCENGPELMVSDACLEAETFLE